MNQATPMKMEGEMRQKILDQLAQHRIMTVATLRPDGWPQATTVGYANDGLTLYFLCGPESQKAANLARDDRVSLTIDHDTAEVMEITGLSMAARARPVTDGAEIRKAVDLLMARYDVQKSAALPALNPEDARIYRLTPVVISVLDYAKGFGHTDLVDCQAAEGDGAIRLSFNAPYEAGCAGRKCTGAKPPPSVRKLVVWP